MSWSKVVEARVVPNPGKDHDCAECKEPMGREPHLKLVGRHGNKRRYVKRIHLGCVRPDAPPIVQWALRGAS